VAFTNARRFRARVAREVAQLGASQPAAARPVDKGPLEDLPAPVVRYLSQALGGRTRAVTTARLRHGGRFRPKLEGGWLPVRGQQYFVTDPPGFIWWGRVRLFPGLWIDARDRSVSGEANMFISMESTLTLADSRGPELDSGALHRVLGEMTWFPTAFLDSRYVTWTAVDDQTAQATLRVNGREVTGVFSFGPDGLPVSFRAQRYRDIGRGESVLTTFSGEYADYRDVEGLRVPQRVVGHWHVNGRKIPYAIFEVEALAFDTGAAR
jgi:hypothetical protein